MAAIFSPSQPLDLTRPKDAASTGRPAGRRTALSPTEQSGPANYLSDPCAVHLSTFVSWSSCAGKRPSSVFQRRVPKPLLKRTPPHTDNI